MDEASWERWFEAMGHPAYGPRYQVVESHAHTLEAASAGRGLVLGWRHLIGCHVEAGTLMMQADGFVETGRCLDAVLAAKGGERRWTQACLTFFAGSSKHRVGGWAEP